MGGQIYKKSVLIPLWVIQLIGLAAVLGSSAFAFVLAHKAEENWGYINGTYVDQDVLDILKISAAINIGFSGLTIIFDFVEIGLFVAHKLKPGAFVVLATLKTVIWAAFSALAINAIINGYPEGWAIVLPLVLFFTSLCQVYYSSSIRRRVRNGTLNNETHSSEEEGRPKPQMAVGSPEYTTYLQR